MKSWKKQENVKVATNMSERCKVLPLHTVETILYIDLAGGGSVLDQENQVNYFSDT